MPFAPFPIMRKFLASPRQRLFLVPLLVPFLVWADRGSDGVAGRWLAPAHGSGQPAAVVTVTIAGDSLSGRIDSLLRQPADARCRKCRDHRKDQPVVGMEILRGFVFAEDRWTGGFILDPESGREFRAEVAATADRKRLKIRGYLGWKWIGMDVFWIRAE